MMPVRVAVEVEPAPLRWQRVRGYDDRADCVVDEMDLDHPGLGVGLSGEGFTRDAGRQRVFGYARHRRALVVRPTRAVAAPLGGARTFLRV